MADRSDQFADLRAMIDRSIHGTATAEDLIAIERIIDTDESARRFYLDYTLVHIGLQWEQGALKDLATASTPTITPPERAASAGRAIRFPHAFGGATLAVAAAVLLAAAVVAIYLVVAGPRSVNDQPSIPPIATLIESTGTVVIGSDVANPGQEYAPGEYSIGSGSAQFLLTNNVGVVLRGNSSLVIENPLLARLQRGSATFTCPPNATGYTVQLPDGAHVVDLGTRFRIDISPDGSARVVVLEGRVSVRNPHDEPVDLTDLDSATLIAGRIERVDRSAPAAAFWSLRDRLSEDDSVVRWLAFDGGAESMVNLVDVEPTTGVFDTDGSLHVGSRDAHIEIDLPRPMRQATILALVKLDADAPRRTRAIMNSDGIGRGKGLHWQIGAAGHIDAQGAKSADGVIDTLSDRWAWLALVIDHEAGTKRIYVNGRKIADGSCRTDTATVLGTVRLGNWSGEPRPLIGAIDEFAVFDRVLTNEELNEIAATADSQKEEPVNETEPGSKETQP